MYEKRENKISNNRGPIGPQIFGYQKNIFPMMKKIFFFYFSFLCLGLHVCVCIWSLGAYTIYKKVSRSCLSGEIDDNCGFF